MKYETAKQLKDAGFPVIHTKTEYRHPSGEPFPTLQELIHAVKADHKLVEMITDKNGNDKWCAQASNLHPRWIESVMYFDTPEEAVANLWLALHNK